MTGKQPIIEKGYAPVPIDSPGLGIELNEEVVKKHLRRMNPDIFCLHLNGSAAFKRPSVELIYLSSIA